jgi:hypothetical protein
MFTKILVASVALLSLSAMATEKQPTRVTLSKDAQKLIMVQHDTNCCFYDSDCQIGQICNDGRCENTSTGN